MYQQLKCAPFELVDNFAQLFTISVYKNEACPS